MKLLSKTIVALAVMAAAGCSKQADNAASNAAPEASAQASTAQLPDWSGIWSMTEETRDTRVAGSNVRDILTPKYAARVPKFGPPPSSGDLPSQPSQLPPLTAPKLQGLAQNMAQCIPYGFPANLTHPYAHEYLFTPGRVTMMIEDGEVRRIYTDGRQHPSFDELEDSLVGHSIGHWEGDTLVVDTIGIRPEAELSMGLHPTRSTHVVERIHKKDANLLQIDTEITDPEMFTKPYSYTMVFERAKGELMENNCLLDQRDNDSQINLTPPPPPPQPQS